MAFKNGLGDRMDELRYSNPRSPPDDTPFSGYISPPRGQSNNFMNALRQPVNDARASLQRRFTEGSGKMSTLTPIGQPTQVQVPEPIDMSSLVSFQFPSQPTSFRGTSLDLRLDIRNSLISNLIHMMIEPSLTKEFPATSQSSTREPLLNFTSATSSTPH
jgi:hypothetical protein